MATILAIDAAWTSNQPSGVALVQESCKHWRCLAVAPSYESFIDLADGTTIDWSRPQFRGCVPNIDLILEAARKLSQSSVDLVAVDMPLATVPITSRREADNMISREFGSRLCSAHSPNNTRPGQLGAALSQGFVDAGFPLRTTQPAPGGTPALIEVYPHPALLSLLQRKVRVQYKVSKSTRYWSGRTVPERATNLINEFNAILRALSRVFGQLPFQIPNASSITRLASLKRYEDALDALICAWVGTEFLAARAVPLGDITAAIWCPQDILFNTKV